MIRTTAEFGVETVRVEGRSGVWVLADDRGPDRKLGAIGVRVSRRVTMHGFREAPERGPRGWRPVAPRDAAGSPVVRRRLSRRRNAADPDRAQAAWIRTTAKMGPEYTGHPLDGQGRGLHTVCQEAGCPNIFECWEDREATFLIGGDTCTRRCDFCDIATGRPQALDLDEPRRVAESVRTMGLRYSTVTGVARDDQPDGAAGLYAETIRQIHALNPTTGVEILPPTSGPSPSWSVRSSTRGPRCSRTTSRRCRASSSGSARRSPTTSRSRCCRWRARPRWSPSPTSSSGWARRTTRSSRRSATCTTPAATSSRSPSTCAPPPSTTRSTGGSSRRSSCTGPHWPRTSASRASWRARSCARPTGPVGCGPCSRDRGGIGRPGAASLRHPADSAPLTSSRSTTPVSEQPEKKTGRIAQARQAYSAIKSLASWAGGCCSPPSARRRCCSLAASSSVVGGAGTPCSWRSRLRCSQQ
jgi:hypothetical protein